ncbi:hypothetical protein RhiJN_06949 [Ceratobasidium sp. AG-Ba]|nr:hypothetical protein RhiJN_06949 [Ceratobasidium sp. AG-Ba]
MHDRIEQQGPERKAWPSAVRAFFSLPGHIRDYYPGPLAYVEVFRSFEATPASPYGRMFSTGPELDARDRRRIIVVPVNEIVAACHLVPKFNELDPDLRLDPYTDVLSIGRHFWFNHYYTHYIFLLSTRTLIPPPTLSLFPNPLAMPTPQFLISCS